MSTNFFSRKGKRERTNEATDNKMKVTKKPLDTFIARLRLCLSRKHNCQLGKVDRLNSKHCSDELSQAV